MLADGWLLGWFWVIPGLCEKAERFRKEVLGVSTSLLLAMETVGEI